MKLNCLLLILCIICFGCADEVFIFKFDKKPKWNHKEYSFALDKDHDEYKGVYITRIIYYTDGKIKTNTVYTTFLGVWKENQADLDAMFQ